MVIPPRMLHGWPLKIRGQLDEANGAGRADTRLIALSSKVAMSYSYIIHGRKIRQARQIIRPQPVTWAAVDVRRGGERSLRTGASSRGIWLPRERFDESHILP